MLKLADLDTAIYYEFCDLEDQDGNPVDYEGEFQREYMSARVDTVVDLNAWIKELKAEYTL